MKILTIHITNPITGDSIRDMADQIKASDEYTHLMIDVGDHNFESFHVIKMMRETLEDLQHHLSRFSRIAMIHPPEYHNCSESPETFQYFDSIKKAEKWFLQ